VEAPEKGVALTVEGSDTGSDPGTSGMDAPSLEIMACVMQKSRWSKGLRAGRARSSLRNCGDVGHVLTANKF
jgi:hypothetical protein